MNRYRVKIQTVKQYLNDRADSITVYASDQYRADTMVGEIVAVLNQSTDDTSAYQIYSYEFI